jgi:hypothetical protein
MPTKTVCVGVTRFDLPERNTHGYMVRISRVGKKYQRFFSDSKHGGKRKALAAAVACYQEWAEQLPAPLSTRNRLTPRNQSGRVGVYVAVSQDKHGSEYRAFCATWTGADGKRRKINFSINRYGKKKAWELACLAREREVADRAEVLAMYEKQVVNRAPRRKK